MDRQKYFTVSGQKLVVDRDDDGKEIDRKILPSRLRFESLEQKDAEAFASDVYRHEKIVLEIHEITRPAH